jgi:hypothetical protein
MTRLGLIAGLLAYWMGSGMAAEVAADLPGYSKPETIAMYSLCRMKDAQCMPLLRSAYVTAVAENKPNTFWTFCLRGHVVSDDQLYSWFMDASVFYKDSFTLLTAPQAVAASLARVARCAPTP